MTTATLAFPHQMIRDILDPMQNPPEAFIKPHFAEYDIMPIVEDWLREAEGRALTSDTIKNYRKGMLSFTRSLDAHKKPQTLASLSEGNVLAWKTDLRKGGSAAATLRAYMCVVKVFSNRWLKRRYSTHDLLELIELGKIPVEQKEAFTLLERERLLASVDGSSFEQVRDRAFVQLLLATACRFKEIHWLTTDSIDIEAKRLWVVLKGGRQVPVDIDGKALRDFKVYLGRRRVVAGPDTTAVWLSDSGKPLSYWGSYAIFLRLESRSGVKCNPHKFRHTVAQMAASAGAPVADIQDLLHHQSDHMSRRYIGNARQDVAAGLAKKWSLAG